MKIILSNFLEHFQEWKEKIESNKSQYLDNIVSDIEQIIDSTDTSKEKAIDLTEYIQDMSLEDIRSLFNYNDSEAHTIIKSIISFEVTSFLQKEFENDLTKYEQKTIKDQIDDNRNFLSLGIKESRDVNRLFDTLSTWKRESIIDELKSLDSNGVYSDKESIGEFDKPATTNELLAVLIRMLIDGGDFENYLQSSTNAIDVAKIIDNLEEDSIRDLDEKLVDEYTVDEDGVIFLMISDFLIFYVPQEGWGYLKYNQGYENIHEVIQKSIVGTPAIDLDYTHELLGKIDFSDLDDYSELYAITDDYVNNMVDPSFLDETHITNSILNQYQLSNIMKLSSEVYATGMVIVNYLYTEDGEKPETSEAFEKDYPWNDSFDDVMNEVIYYFNNTFNELNKHNGDMVSTIVNIDKINQNVEALILKGESETINDNFIDFDSAVMKYSAYMVQEGFNEESWKQIYVNDEFKELFVSNLYKFNYTDKDIAKYFATQLSIDYSKL